MTGGRVDILIIDDSPEDADLVAGALKRRLPAASTMIARDGGEAIEFLDRAAAADLPRVILVDLMMPRVDGFEVLRRLRSSDKTRSVPVVVLTSSGLQRDVERAYALGANSYVVKPVAYEEVCDVVGCLGAYWLERNRAPASGPDAPAPDGELGRG